MILPHAFISLERSVATTLRAALRESLGPNLQAMVEAHASGDTLTAHDLADDLSLFGAVERQGNRLEELAVAAMLFGAQNLTGSLRKTTFMQGPITLPVEVTQALQQLSAALSYAGADRLRARAHLLVDMVRKAEEPLSFAAMLDKVVSGLADTTANLTVSRLANFGFLSEAAAAGVTQYQVNEVLDDKTCPVCLYMHGKVFDVAEEYGKTLEALHTQDPQDLRNIAPWPSQTKDGLRELNRLSAEELQDRGYGSPPYHPGCRGMLVAVGTVTEEIALGGLLAAFPQILRGGRTDYRLESVADPRLRDRISRISDPSLVAAILAAYSVGAMDEVSELLGD